MNPLDIPGKPFKLEFFNPNPTFSKTEKGPIFRVSFEIPKDDWENFVLANTKGMIIAAVCNVVELNPKQDDQSQEPVNTQGEKKKRKLGPLAIEAYQLCRDKVFQEFMHEAGEDGAALNLKETLGVEKREYIDGYPAAINEFNILRTAFANWKMSR